MKRLAVCALALAAIAGCKEGLRPGGGKASVTLGVSAESLMAGYDDALPITVTDDDGDTVIAPVTWTSSDSAIAGVNGQGHVYAHRVGTTLIVASAGSVADTAAITVVPILSFADPAPVVLAGDTATLLIHARDESGPVALPAIVWSSNAPATATVSGGVVSGLAAGTATITATASPSSVSWPVTVLRSPAGINREIAFVIRDYKNPSAYDQVRLMNPVNRVAVPLTAYVTSIEGIRWSPDGAKLAVQYGAAAGAAKRGLWVMNADGSADHIISATGFDPAWSPDAGSLVFADSGGGALGLYADAAAGGHRRPVATLAPGGGHPDWSWDGSAIVYAQSYTEIWVVRSDGIGAHVLKQETGLDYGGVPRWSPDMRRITYSAAPYNGIWMMNADGSQRTPVSANCAGGTCVVAGFPYPPAVWSADGRRLYYQHTGAGGMAWVDVLTGAQTPIPWPIGSNVFSVSPDQSLIAFRSGADLMTMGIAGGSLRRLTILVDTLEAVRSFAWRP